MASQNLIVLSRDPETKIGPIRLVVVVAAPLTITLWPPPAAVEPAPLDEELIASVTAGSAESGAHAIHSTT